ncbi:MAG: phosphotransferase, partial [Gammaproteobacteria bacterium]
SALSQPTVLVHRDFHSRNLMLLDNGGIGVIDFQDAVTGPLTYDLVSLLRDCYIRWPASYVSRRALNYYRRAVAAGIATPVSDKQFMRWFDLMGLQRHIKVLGIFARLFLRDGKAGYLNDLPLVIRYTLEQLDSYPELNEFKDWFERRVLPAVIDQSWYQPWQQAGDSQREPL